MKPSATAFLTVFSLSLVASATTTEECVEAHVSAQQLRARSELLEAKQEVVRCGAPSCPGVLRSECGQWLSELDKEIPSFVVVVTDSKGAGVGAVELKLDDGTRQIRPGTANETNPGPHTLEARAAGYQTARLEFTANVRDRQQRVRITLEPLEGPAPQWPYVPLAAGVALGTTAFVVLGARARAEEKDLADTCEPDCSDSKIAAVRRKYLGANIGLGVAAASLVGIGFYYYFSRSKVSVRPTAGGPSVQFTAHF